MISALAILNQAFEYKKLRSDSKSLRNISRELTISPSYLSSILKGKRPIPIHLVESLISVLGMDPLLSERFKLQLTTEQIGFKLNSNTEVEMKETKSFEIANNSDWSLLNPWFNVAILDLSTCKDFNLSPQWIAKKIGITLGEVKDSLHFLIENGFLKEQHGKFTKTKNNLRFSVDRPKHELRQYYKDIFNQAVQLLNRNSSIEDYKKRQITGTMTAVNINKLEEAKLILLDAQRRAAQVLSEGDCTEVYFIGSNLLPITK